MSTLPRFPPRATTAAALALAAVAAAGPAGPALAGDPERVSVGPGGVQGDDWSYGPALSADGRHVAFVSYATNLVPGETGAFRDVFVRDLRTGRTRLVSVGSGGQGDETSLEPALSADGHLVAFTSRATNLVPDDTNGVFDVFVRDLGAGTTRRVSVGPDGRQAAGESRGPAISAAGRYLAFDSGAANLIPGDTNGTADVFVHDLRARTTTRVSVGRGGRQADGASLEPAISADGRFVAFHSEATNLVPGDTNGVEDVFVHDRRTGGTTRVSVGPGGAEGDGYSLDAAVSADGRQVAFLSDAGNLVRGDTNRETDVFVRDLRTGRTTRASVGPGGAQAGSGSDRSPAISANGRLVAFSSVAANLVAGDTNGKGDVFVRNLRTGVTRRPSTGPGGVQGDDYSQEPALSSDGRVLTFSSDATNLVPGDTNDSIDVFVRSR